MLKAVGLTPVEEQVYRALVRARSMSPAEIRQRLDLSSEQADAVFGSLAAKGLVTSTAGSSKRLVVAPVDVAGEALLLRRLEELQTARLEFVRLAEEYRSVGGSNSVDELIEIAPAEAVPMLFEQLQRQAQSEVWMITAPPYAVPSDKNSVEIERLACGVAYLGLYTREALEEPGAVETIRHYVDAGEQARMLPGLTMKLAVFDRKVAIVPVSHASRISGGSDCLIVHVCSLLDALMELFERLWVSAMPMAPMLSGAGSPGAAPPARSQAISPQESQLITLLLAGMTDDAIGRQLDIARRTVVRRVQQLMARAKAANRLQLILRAAQLGWVDVNSTALMPHDPTEHSGTQVVPQRGVIADTSAPGRTSPAVVHREIPSLTVVGD
jgi:DNA-binding CsgD family transcriptional regulator/DNA-binding MarR family transcriptional regulator